ncbi:hypothetical protein RHMOL_Rhmol06G0325600 [Rhododendron molle]|uniref:Uncharacterized protein n=1 Tax=Rhododendron molle TaxID=49168 RepID=A0ACC0NJJ6_RHOML|nr:hypothetical protein RHMOL_Rhmol06G0325600 [Rhododendron molle]
MPNSLLIPHHSRLAISSHRAIAPRSVLFINHPTPSPPPPPPPHPLPLVNKEPSFGGKRQQQRGLRLTTTTRALRRREWKEYEEAVKDKDLARALRFLKDIPDPENSSSSPVPMDDDSSIRSLKGGARGGGLSSGWVVEWERDLEVLDACLNADDMRLVGATYSFLKDRGFLPNFAKCRKIVSKLSPKKWGLSQSSSIVLVTFLGGVSFLLNQGIDVRPNLAAILGLAMMDSIFLGGSCLAQISSYWPPYRRRILVHEAGHLLTAYLLGCPIRGVILDPIVAMQMGIQGQAGTQFWDENLQKELSEGRLSGTAFDRYCMVLFAGIAAEALVYGEAEGGENDENLFRSICVLLEPPLSVAQMSNQARWSVLQSYNILKWHKHAHRAAVEALESGGSLSVVIRRIEEAMSSTR